jgi:diguanylate cyclase (GGDEF)-like protein/PAS domain S-box-containing protein
MSTGSDASRGGIESATRVPRDDIAAVLTGLPDPVLVLNRELRIVRAAGGALGPPGWEPERLEGQPLAEVFADPSTTLIPRCRAAADGRASNFEFREPKGQRSFRCYAAPRYEADRLVGAVLTMQEIAEEREAARSVAEERKLFLEAFSAASIGMAMTALDGTFLRVNARLVQMTGHSEGALLGRRLTELTDPRGPGVDDEALARLAAKELDEYAHEGRYVRADGSTFTGALRVARVTDDRQRALFFVAHLADVTDRNATKDALRQLTERFASAFENAPLGMALLTKRGRPFQANRALAQITGYTRAELLAMSVTDIVHPDDVTDAVVKSCEQLLAGELEAFQGELRWFDASGHVVWVSLYVSTVRGPGHEPDQFVVQVTDISGRKRMQDRMEFLADHDDLTGLLNRRRFEAELSQNVARAQRYGETAALLLVDLDRFKHVNDTLGHSVGDRLLKHAAGLLKERLRETDVIGRLGGDEFAILLPHVSAQQAREVAEDLGDVIRSRPMTHESAPVECSASIGVSAFDDSVGSGEDLLIAADLAMYRAKDGGRGRAFADQVEPDGGSGVSSGLQCAEYVRSAIADARFALEAQPIVNVATGLAEQHELLIRLLDPDGGLMPPRHFLYFAERFGLVGGIDRWVIREAIELLSRHPDGLTLAVNVSGRSITDPTLAESVAGELALAGVDARRLVFEIAESEAIRNLDAAIQFAESVTMLGCKIAIDDFGGGGFGYIKRLPFDYIKIDGCFVRGVLADPNDRLIVEALVHVAVGMGKRTVAECVTDAEILGELVRLGVDCAQGYHTGRPAPLAEALGPEAR